MTAPIRGRVHRGPDAIADCDDCRWLKHGRSKTVLPAARRHAKTNKHSVAVSCEYAYRYDYKERTS